MHEFLNEWMTEWLIIGSSTSSDKIITNATYLLIVQSLDLNVYIIGSQEIFSTVYASSSAELYQICFLVLNLRESDLLFWVDSVNYILVSSF